MNPPTVLVVEDDGAIRRGILDALQFEGYLTLEAADGDSGRELALGSECALVLLDLVLPKRDGFAVLRELHAVRPELPVIVLTARGEEADRVHGLRLGADDYVVKPFSVQELLARVSAVLRRVPRTSAPARRIRFPGGSADLSSGEIALDDGGALLLSPRETQLMRYLAAHEGRAVSREELLVSVWGIDPKGIETRTVDMQIARLREKLGDTSDNAKILVTVRGRGYRLMVGESPC